MSSLYKSSEIEWCEYNEQNILTKNYAHIFKINCNIYDMVEKNLSWMLSVAEIEKMNRFFKPDDRKRYALGKYFSRQLLGKILNIEPQSLSFLMTKTNKPYLKDMNFNISHSGDYVVIAISIRPIGIDIELIKNHFDHDSLEEVCFTRNERKLITTLEDFYTFWTRKEALLKATGEGLIDDLLDIECIATKITRNNQTYVMDSHLIENNYLLSLAYDESIQKVNFWDVNTA